MNQLNIDENTKNNLPTILDGKFFTILNIKDGKVTARCMHCINKKELRGKLGVTSNFLRHLKVLIFIYCNYTYVQFKNKLKLYITFNQFAHICDL